MSEQAYTVTGSWQLLTFLALLPFTVPIFYILHVMHYITRTYSFFNWKVVLHNPLYPFCTQSSSPPITTNLSSVSMSLGFALFHLSCGICFFSL